MTRMSPWKVTTDPMILRRVGKTGEELCEAGAVCCRIVIQGIDEIDPSSGNTNRQRLLQELADVQAQIDCTRKALLAGHDEAFEERVLTKVGNMDDWESQMREPSLYKSMFRFVKETSFGVTPTGQEISPLRRVIGPIIAVRAFPHETQEVPCSSHPCAPHGFNRNASHSADRYVCDCEGQGFPCPGPIDHVLCLDCPNR